MNNNLLQIKIKQRLNKLASFDYDNLECWQVTEAFNKAQINWTRRQIYGLNLRKEGAEQSSGLVDDLQKLLIGKDIVLSDKDTYYESDDLPSDYLHYVRSDVWGKNECCPERRIIVYEVEEANISIILDNKDKAPSFEWAETVSTRIDNKLRVYTENEFDITKCYLVYFRKPREVQIAGCIDINSGTAFTADQTCEFNDDVAEIILDEAAAVLAGDIEAINQFQRQQAVVKENTG